MAKHFRPGHSPFIPAPRYEIARSLRAQTIALYARGPRLTIPLLHRCPLGTSLYNQTDCPPLVGSAMECADSAIIKTTCGFPMYTTGRAGLAHVAG